MFRDDNRLANYCYCLYKDLQGYIFLPKNKTYIVSFPKAGRTWLQYMLNKLYLNKETISDQNFFKCMHDDSGILSEAGVNRNVYRLFDYGSRMKFKGRKVILLVRDPRDIVVSLFHQLTKRSDKPLDTNLEDLVMNDVLGISRVIRFYEVWFANILKPKDVLVVRYEDLLELKGDALFRITKFIGSPARKDLCHSMYEECTVDKMREKEKQGKIEGMRLFGDDPNA